MTILVAGLILVVVALFWILVRFMAAREPGGLKKYIKPPVPPEDLDHGNAYGVSEWNIARRVAMQKSIKGNVEHVTPPDLESATSARVEDKDHTDGGPSISIVVRPGDSLLSELGRRATAAKNAGNLDLAIDCLVRQRARAAELGQDLPVQTLLRLPLLLQRKGDFQSALAEFEVLLESADTLAGFPGITPARKAMLVALWRRDVYDKMRVACKRQKETDLVNEYALAAERESEQLEVLREVVNEEYQRQHEAYVARQAERSKRRSIT